MNFPVFWFFLNDFSALRSAGRADAALAVPGVFRQGAARRRAGHSVRRRRRWRSAPRTGFVDWARTRLWDGDSSPRLGEAYAALARQADQARQQENREFGRLLAGWPGSGLHDRSLLGVEAVLDRRGTVPQRNLDAFAVGLDAFYTAVGEELASVGGPYSPRTALNFARRGAVYLVITGTPAFFEGPQGVRRLPPLAQRLAVDFSGAPRFDNPRAPQVRLHNFDLPRLQGVGRKIRDLHAGGATAPARVELEP